MKRKRGENAEKVMLTAALFFIGGFLCVPVKMRKREAVLPVFRPVRMETEETGRKETEETSDKMGYKMTAVDLEESGQEKRMEMLSQKKRETADDIYSVEPDRRIVLSADEGLRESAPMSQEAEASADVLTVSDNPVKKAEKEVKPWIDIPDSLWTENQTKTLTALSYMGGLRTVYCVGDSDMKLGEINIYAHYSDGSCCRILPLLLQIEGFSAGSPGKFQGKISFQGMSVTVPYEVADFQVILHLNGGARIGTGENVCHLYNYTLESVEPPQRTGYAFDGWYLEEELVTAAEFPFHTLERVTHLYAGWKKYETSYTSEDGILLLPDSCTAIGERAFWNVNGKVEEVYVGAGVSEIAPGAFSGLDDLSYIDVDWKNSHYTTINCGLYTKDGKRLIAYPNVLSGICRVYAGTEVLGKYAFYESGISTLILPENLKGIEGYVFGRNLKVLRFQGTTPPESLSREAFAGISEDLAIEVPEASLESYRKALGEISPELEEKTVGF